MTELKGIRFYYLRKKGIKQKRRSKVERILFDEKRKRIKEKATRINLLLNQK